MLMNGEWMEDVIVHAPRKIREMIAGERRTKI
jgi:hypothetical protein